MTPLLVMLMACGSGLSDIEGGTVTGELSADLDSWGQPVGDDIRFKFYVTGSGDNYCPNLRGKIPATLDELELTEMTTDDEDFRSGRGQYDCEEARNWVYEGTRAEFYADIDTSVILLGEEEHRFEVDGLRGEPAVILDSGATVEPGQIVEAEILPVGQRWSLAYHSEFMLRTPDNEVEYQLCHVDDSGGFCDTYEVQSTGAIARLVMPDLCESGPWKLIEPLRTLDWTACSGNFDCDDYYSDIQIGTGSRVWRVAHEVDVDFSGSYSRPPCP